MHYAKFRHHEDAVAPGATSPHPKTPSRHIEQSTRAIKRIKARSVLRIKSYKLIRLDTQSYFSAIAMHAVS